ncbi:hypothetical protein [Ancylobacter rudongensis]|uniref:hypothetical protein n=1 Tax=Ancylobacter rudongensis TaxID=177413 RepID=UPI000B896477|nr:hypothetical protein [Ancylobacter rudongensis]
MGARLHLRDLERAHWRVLEELAPIEGGAREPLKGLLRTFLSINLQPELIALKRMQAALRLNPASLPG